MDKLCEQIVLDGCFRKARPCMVPAWHSKRHSARLRSGGLNTRDVVAGTQSRVLLQCLCSSLVVEPSQIPGSIQLGRSSGIYVRSGKRGCLCGFLLHPLVRFAAKALLQAAVALLVS